MLRKPARHRQRGVVLLAAILLVALGTIVAAAIAFNNAMTARRGTAALAFDHGLLVAQAAESLAAYALREDAREDQKESNRTDHPLEIWAQPVGPIEVTPGVMLEAGLADMQGRFNLNGLVDDDGNVDERALESFRKLLELLDLEPKWASLVADWIDANLEAQTLDGAEDGLYMAQDPPYRTAGVFIASTTELLALPEFGRERYLKLAPYVAALPRDAKLNLCTADRLVLDAHVPGDHLEYSRLDQETFERYREEGCYPTSNQFRDVVNQAAADPNARSRAMNRVDEQSKYFRLTSIATIGTAEFALYSLLERQNEQTRPILRSFAAD